jgi:hypothetical protein
LLGIGCVTFAAIYFVGGTSAVKEEAGETVVKTLGSPLAAFLLWLVLMLLAQPYLMWGRAQRQLNELTKTLGDQRKYREIAKKIEATVVAGQVIQQSAHREGFIGSVNSWLRFIDKEIAPSLIDEDRAMFNTLVGPIEEPFLVNDQYIKAGFVEKIGRAIAKLRMIMARYYRAAEKFEARDLERDADNESVDTS